MPVRTETPVEYFRELVEAALLNQGLAAGELTACYVVHMLAGFTHVDATRDSPLGDEPLAFGLVRALDSAGVRRRAELKRVGDVALFVAGFFSDSLKRSLVDIDYYTALGGYAYGSLGRHDGDSCAAVFAELAEKFAAFVDVLEEVSERSAMGSNTDLLRLYEKWLRTGSRRGGDLLVERGIVPNASVRTRFLQ